MAYLLIFIVIFIIVYSLLENDKIKNKGKNKKKKSLWYGFCSVLLLIVGFNFLLPYNTVEFNYWNVIFICTGSYGLITYYRSQK